MGKGKRRDEYGRAFAGSQLQIQIYVNRRRERLNAAILSELPVSERDATIDWRSPLEACRFAEFMDGRFLEALGLPRLAPRLEQFWPRSGPRWDGLAVLTKSSAPCGYLLVEAKSYPDELLGRGCGAVKDSDSHQLIK